MSFSTSNHPNSEKNLGKWNARDTGDIVRRTKTSCRIRKGSKRRIVQATDGGARPQLTSHNFKNSSESFADVKTVAPFMNFKSAIKGRNQLEGYDSYILSPETLYGVDCDDLCFISDQRLAMVDDWMSRNPVSLVRSPSTSGKKTLSVRLQKYLERKGRTVINLTARDIRQYGADKDLNSFNCFWYKYAGRTWSDCFNCKEPTDVFINDVESLYQCADFFWRMIEHQMQSPSSNPLLRVQLLGTYGEMPIALPPVLDLKTYACGVMNMIQWLTILMDARSTFPVDDANPIISQIVRNFERSGLLLRLKRVIAAGFNLLLHCIADSFFRTKDTNFVNFLTQKWLIAARKVIPLQAKMNFNVGLTFGSTGFLRVFISFVNWGVEVIQEGELIPEYAKWLTEREVADVSGPLRQWAIVEFRRKSRRKCEPKSNHWHVLYDDDCKNITIEYGNGVNLRVNLRGT
ncbi:hypothetical protein BDQ17DRAFT_1328909 [Cyathus striatus]|nr:hypothetical protein BDQ17DRAFT_1328909 [Cyathus striatus]